MKNYLSSYECLYSYHCRSDKNQISCNMTVIAINNELIICALYISPKTYYSTVREKFLKMLKKTVTKIYDQEIILNKYSVIYTRVILH